MKTILILSIVTAGMLTLTMFKALSTPDVEFSYSTKQCVAVFNTDGTKGSCNNLPSKYNHVWVK